jgi:hypothetical protein
MEHFFTIGILVLVSSVSFIDIQDLYALTDSTLLEPINGASGGLNKPVANMTTANATAGNITQKMEFLNRVLR